MTRDEQRAALRRPPRPLLHEKVKTMKTRAQTRHPKITSNGLIRAMADRKVIVMLTNTKALGPTYFIEDTLRPLDTTMVERLVKKGVLLDNGDTLFSGSPAQSYRLAPSWGGQ